MQQSRNNKVSYGFYETKCRGMKPSTEYSNLILLLRKCLQIIGADVYDRGYRPNRLTLTTLGVLIMYLGFSVSSALIEFAENPYLLLQVLAMSGCVIKTLVKFYRCCFQAATEISSTNEFLIQLFQDYETRSSCYCEVVAENVRYTKRIMRTLLMTVVLPSAMFIVIPMVYSFSTGERYLLLPFRIPGINAHTTQGYNLTLGIQVVITIMSLSGLFASDILLATLLVQPIFFFNIFKCKIGEINEVLELGKPEPLTKRNQVTDLLRDLSQWHQLSLGITAKINRMFSPVITTVILASAAAIILSLFILCTSKWPNGYGFLLLGFHGLYIYCLIGTRIEMCNDDFMSEIYNIKWYNLSISQRKTVFLMLMRAQTPEQLLVANILPLSVDTGLRVTNIIYSGFMMMIHVLT